MDDQTANILWYLISYILSNNIASNCLCMSCKNSNPVFQFTLSQNKKFFGTTFFLFMLTISLVLYFLFHAKYSAFIEYPSLLVPLKISPHKYYEPMRKCYFVVKPRQNNKMAFLFHVKLFLFVKSDLYTLSIIYVCSSAEK